MFRKIHDDNEHEHEKSIKINGFHNHNEQSELLKKIGNCGS